MSGLNLKHALATVAVAVGVLAAAGSATAATHQAGVIYNGHAGLGSATAVTDGTSNTVIFGKSVAALSPDIGPSENIASDGRGADFILMADQGGQFN